MNAVLATAFLILAQTLSPSPAYATCITVKDVELQLGQPTAHLLQQDVQLLSSRYEIIHGKPFVASDEALVYREYMRGTSAAVRVILFRNGCGLRDGGIPRQVFDVMMSGLYW